MKVNCSDSTSIESLHFSILIGKMHTHCIAVWKARLALIEAGLLPQSWMHSCDRMSENIKRMSRHLVFLKQWLAQTGLDSPRKVRFRPGLTLEEINLAPWKPSFIARIKEIRRFNSYVFRRYGAIDKAYECKAEFHWKERKEGKVLVGISFVRR